MNEDQSHWVKQMFSWLVDECLSTNAITRRLRSLGVETPSGKGYWIRSTVGKILRNPAYYGRTYAFTVTYGEPQYRLKQDTKRKKSGKKCLPREKWIETCWAVISIAANVAEATGGA